MTFFRRLFPVALVALAFGLCLIPTQRAPAQCSDCAAPQSDVSGALVQSDLTAFQSDQARVRVDDAHLRLVAALQRGTIIVHGEPMAVPPYVVDMLTEQHVLEDAPVQTLMDRWVARGLSRDHAAAIVTTTGGLLNQEDLDPDALVAAVETFNTAVDAAPPLFLVRAPRSFVVVRTVLMELMDAAAV